MLFISEPVKFWTIMNDLGMMDDILEIVFNSFDQTRRLANMGTTQRDIGKCEQFG
ncbi:unnamed protein product [Anisakis simplex]|uniref:DNA-binding protein n=1 Tax=Anisakis simplex TaxID=6269 RepID=A0A0M3JN44_ANISI|nr:unnamed protein product [Anisakis simplex]